jgi:protoheme IX farnesyltransferase
MPVRFMTNSEPVTPAATGSGERAWRRRFTFLTSLLTLCLIYAGSLVTSTGSGLSVPDWPTTYGENMFTFPVSRWVGGIFYEHSHRLLASLVGFLILVQAFWVGSRDRRVRAAAYAALAAVIAQGVLGGVTVLLGLSPLVSVLHGVLGQTLFALTVYIAYSQSRERETRLTEKPLSLESHTAVTRAALGATALVYLQLIFGAMMRHNGAGLAVPDFPLMGGRLVPLFDTEMFGVIDRMRFEMLLPPVTAGQIAIHLAHRAGAIAVAFGAVWVTRTVLRVAREDGRLVRHVVIFDALVFLQAALGALTIWSAKDVYLTSLHVVAGAALLGWSSLLVLRASRVGGASAGVPNAPEGPSSAIGDFVAGCWELSKPRLNLMVIVSAAIGYLFAGSGELDLGRFVTTLVGIGIAGAGASALNQYLERDYDAQMERTRLRPIPRGAMSPFGALLYGLAATLGGVFLLVGRVNLLAGFVILLTAFLYVLVYTPIKRLTWLNTSVGAIPGALPPVAGWAAATGELGAGALALFVVLFIWQHPHFFAIAWMHRRDYAAGGFRMLPVVEPDGASTFRLISIFSILLGGAAALVPAMAGELGAVYVCGALVLGAGIFAFGLAADRSRSVESARRLFRASLAYIPALLFFAILDSLI